MFIIGQLRNGGAERVICNLCNNLKDEYNITLVVRSLKDADKAYIPDVNIIEVNELSWWLTTLFGIFKIRKLKKKLKIDTSVSFHLKYNIYNYFSKYKDKIIFSIRNYESCKLNSYTFFQKFIYKKVIKKADIIVNVSRSVMEDQIKIYGSNKNIVIPNYVDLKKIDKLKKEDVFIEDDTILTVGRFVHQKGIIHLINSMKHVNKYNSNIKLLIIGRGPLKEQYKRLIKKLCLEDNIKILDFTDNVYKYMYNCKLFILPSLFEGMPNVLLEALGCGCPIIATDSFGGSKEILKDEYDSNHISDILYSDYGVLVPNFDKNTLKNEKLLADSIIKLFSDKKLYNKYKKLSIKRAKDFSLDEILDLWRKII